MNNSDRESLVTDMADFIHDRRIELGWEWFDLDYDAELAGIAGRLVDFLAAQRVADE